MSDIDEKTFHAIRERDAARPFEETKALEQALRAKLASKGYLLTQDGTCWVVHKVGTNTDDEHSIISTGWLGVVAYMEPILPALAAQEARS